MSDYKNLIRSYKILLRLNALQELVSCYGVRLDAMQELVSIGWA